MPYATGRAASRFSSPGVRRHAALHSKAAGRLNPAAAALVCASLAFALALAGALTSRAALLHTGGEAMTASRLTGKSRSQSAPATRIALPHSFTGNLPITQLTENEAILHALNTLAYGPRPGEVARIRKIGLAKWINRQLRFTSGDDPALAAKLSPFQTLTMSSGELLAKYPPPNLIAKREGLTLQQYREQLRRQLQAKRAELRQEGMSSAEIQFATIPGPQRIQAELDLATIDRAVYSHRQLYEVMSNFWANHFNVNINKGLDRWLITDYIQNTIRPHAMGNFEDLLVATARSPAMLFYLDNWLSADPAAVKQLEAQITARRERFGGLFAQRRRARKIVERGLNENYGREVMELHTVGVNAGYTQADVIQMAECMTGWTIRAPRRNPEFFFNERIHDSASKTVMGRSFDYGGMQDGLAALHMLATSPATANHISFELAQYFVSDNPPPNLVARMAKTFLASDGDIRAVLKTMIYSPEFWSREALHAKVKTPFELAVSAVRALGANTDDSIPLALWIARMGQPLYQCEPPTGYADTADVWLNAGGLLTRMNFALALATNHIAGVDVAVAQRFGPDAAQNPQAALADSLDDFLGDEVSPQTHAALERQLAAPQVQQAGFAPRANPQREGFIAALVLGSPEFQRR